MYYVSNDVDKILTENDFKPLLIATHISVYTREDGHLILKSLFIECNTIEEAKFELINNKLS